MTCHAAGRRCASSMSMGISGARERFLPDPGSGCIEDLRSASSVPCLAHTLMLTRERLPGVWTSILFGLMSADCLRSNIKGAARVQYPPRSCTDLVLMLTGLPLVMHPHGAPDSVHMILLLRKACL